jgi:hypothetical protein
MNASIEMVKGMEYFNVYYSSLSSSCFILDCF